MSVSIFLHLSSLCACFFEEWTVFELLQYMLRHWVPGCVPSNLRGVKAKPWNVPFKDGEALIWWYKEDGKTYSTLSPYYFRALLTANQHKREVKHLQTVSYYRSILRGEDPSQQFTFAPAARLQRQRKPRDSSKSITAKPKGGKAKVKVDEDNNRLALRASPLAKASGHLST